MVDKDLLAIRYTRHNMDHNAVHNTEVFPSIGTSDIHSKTFDLIVSNVPGHIGDQAIEQDFLLKPLELLNYWRRLLVCCCYAACRTGRARGGSAQPFAARDRQAGAASGVSDRKGKSKR